MVDANCDEQDRRWWNKLATARGQFITLTVHLVQPALERRRNFKWLCEHLSDFYLVAWAFVQWAYVRESRVGVRKG